MNNSTDIPEHVRTNLAVLQKEREKQGMSAGELQKVSGVRAEIITAYEKGTGSPTPSKYNRLAKIFKWEEWK